MRKDLEQIEKELAIALFVAKVALAVTVTAAVISIVTFLVEIL